MSLFNKKAAAVIVGSLSIILLTICSCNSYNIHSPEDTGRSVVAFDLNPGILFDRAGPPRQSYGLGSEGFMRSEWPLADVPTGFVNQGEIASYSESTYDEQRIGADNVPRQYYRRLTRTYRTGVLIR